MSRNQFDGADPAPVAKTPPTHQASSGFSIRPGSDDPMDLVAANTTSKRLPRDLFAPLGMGHQFLTDWARRAE
jgi:hypothetical protein